MSTPVQRQYWELKNQNPEAILFFRLGDFYELFFEDALIGSKVLGITLTARHRGTDNEMPMAGFPHHAHKEYLEKLIEAGYKVAIAEQVETEDKKIIRVIDRIITPGTTLESGNLDPTSHNYLAAINTDGKHYSLAYVDLSTGDFRTAEMNTESAFWDELYKINPQEILLSKDTYLDEDFTRKCPPSLHVPRPFPTAKKADKKLSEHFGDNHLAVAGIKGLAGIIICAEVILEYLQETQKKDLPHLQKIEHYHPGETLILDTQTIRHLEIFYPLTGNDPSSTLWSVFAKSGTALGARQLRHWLQNPLLNTEGINQRLDTVQALCDQPSWIKSLHEILKQVPDLERLLGRLASQRGNARDLAFFRDALQLFPTLQTACQAKDTPLISDLSPVFGEFETLNKTLTASLADTPPLEIMNGGLFRDGFNERLDELRTLQKEADNWLDDFLERAKADSGISKLRIKYSKNFGYCLEVSTGQADQVPDSWDRRQTLVNAERFTTPELADYESRVLSAESEAFALEYELFVELRNTFLQAMAPLQKAAKSIGQIDALVTLARTANQQRWAKPVISDDPLQIKITQGRHPVVEQLSSTPFIANDCQMSGQDSRLHLITGPNMAGKSTYLRQNALIILLGQMGSFVPAEAAAWGIVDRIFTRVGASDNLAAGQSTFFVEMTETASILHQATERSFIILDEIGRGTSTFDGISLAWAITEYLHEDIKAQTLFATHYHELIELVEDLSAAENKHVSVSQNKNGILFLRQIKPGGIADSFGIEVAKLAGVPASVIAKSREILDRLESENLLSGKPTLFSQPRVREVTVEADSAVEKALSQINPDDLTPKEALEQLYELKKLGGN